MPASLKRRLRPAVYFAPICVVTVVFALLWMSSQTATAAGNNITVNSTSDAEDGNDGLCTLREAITAANSNTASGATAGECAAGSPSDSDTISMASLSGTITLTSALPNITSNMTISGPGASQLTISGNNTFRVFNLTLSSPGTVNFTGLTIANGRANMDIGGGIYNQNSANVNVTDSTIRNSSATLGGGVANSSTGTFTITNSTLNNNSANTAGGCYNGSGILNVINSTLNNNVATGANGSAGTGGAINTGSNTLNVINSTLDNNTALGGGGIYSNSPDAIINISNATITENFAGTIGGGGGVNNSNGGTVKILNSLIADNGSQSGADLLGPFVSLGHNFLTRMDGSTGFTVGTNNPNGDLVGTGFIRIFPILSQLQNNGGPTQTRALLPGSPAIDAGDNCVVLASGSGGCLPAPLTTDQRGVSRQVNSVVDIGAYESRSFTLSIISGTPQSTAVNTLFDALVVKVNSVGGDPVFNGLINFTSPASGPSAFFAPDPSIQVAIDPNGFVSPTPQANGIAGGPYTVMASVIRGNSSAAFILTNNPASTTTTVTSSSNPSDLTQSVTFTATVSSTGPLTGTVQWEIDDVNVGGPVTLSGGVATLTTAALTAGTHKISADYSGDANFLPSGGVLLGGQVVRPTPSLSINDITFKEGNAGTKFVFFTVTLSAASNLTVSVDFATANNTATAPSDYLARTGTLTFIPGQVLQSVFVTINGDTTFEPDETFTMNLSNAVNASINRAQGTATIENDEAPVLLTEENTNHIIALDSVTLTRDPFSLTNVNNLSADHRRRVSLFVWRLGLLPGDTVSNVTVQAADDQGRIYLLVVEFLGPVTGLDDVTQVVVRLPDEVIGAPRSLAVTVRVRGPVSNAAFISISGP